MAVKRADIPDMLLGGVVGIGGATIGLSRGVTGLIAIGGLFASIAVRHLWDRWKRKDA